MSRREKGAGGKSPEKAKGAPYSTAAGRDAIQSHDGAQRHAQERNFIKSVIEAFPRVMTSRIVRSNPSSASRIRPGSSCIPSTMNP